MKKNTNKYLSYAEASAVVSKMGIASCKDYWARYKQHPGLPINPGQFYGDEYKGWGDFTGHSRFYLAVDEARRAVITLGIKTWPEYKKRYKEDPKLPSDPASFYGETYRGFTEYSGQTKSDRYATMAEASAAAVRMEMKSSMDYRARFHQNPFLPSDPPAYFSGEWKNWAFFLKVDNAPRAGKGKDDTYESFVVAVRNLLLLARLNTELVIRRIPSFPGIPMRFIKRTGSAGLKSLGSVPILRDVQPGRKPRLWLRPIALPPVLNIKTAVRLMTDCPNTLQLGIRIFQVGSPSFYLTISPA